MAHPRGPTRSSVRFRVPRPCRPCGTVPHGRHGRGTRNRTEDRVGPRGCAMMFHDRRDAGRQLATHLTAYAGRPDVLVLALPRGGVPVGYEVAHALGVPLDVFLVRKLGVPGREELAMGAIASGGVRVLNDDVVRALAIPESVMDAVAAEE